MRTGLDLSQFNSRKLSNSQNILISEKIIFTTKSVGVSKKSYSHTYTYTFCFDAIFFATKWFIRSIRSQLTMKLHTYNLFQQCSFLSIKIQIYLDARERCVPQKINPHHIHTLEQNCDRSCIDCTVHTLPSVYNTNAM